MITDRLGSVFTSKPKRMGKAIQVLGGKERVQMQSKWKETKWRLELKDNEIVPVSRKRKPDNPVVQSCKKRCQQLQKKVNDVNTKLKEVSNQIDSLKNQTKGFLKL